MILNYIKSDLYRYAGKWFVYLYIKYLLIDRTFKYSFWFRLCKAKNTLLKFMAKFIHRKLSRKYNIQIPNTTDIRYGLFIVSVR
jgi:serine O-acetyltransferase